MARKYPDYFQDDNVIFKKTFYSDPATKTTPVDPSSVTFKMKSPTGILSFPVVTDEAGVGNYSAAKIVNEYGIWAWRWMTTGPTQADQGFINVIERNVS